MSALSSERQIWRVQPHKRTFRWALSSVYAYRSCKKGRRDDVGEDESSAAVLEQRVQVLQVYCGSSTKGEQFEGGAAAKT